MKQLHSPSEKHTWLVRVNDLNNVLSVVHFDSTHDSHFIKKSQNSSCILILDLLLTIRYSSRCILEFVINWCVHSPTVWNLENHGHKPFRKSIPLSINLASKHFQRSVFPIFLFHG